MTTMVPVSQWRELVKDEFPTSLYNLRVDRAVVTAAIEFCTRSRFWTVRMAPMNILANIGTYKLRCPNHSKLVTAVELKYNGRNLPPKVASDLDSESPDWEAKTGTPWCYTMLDNATARLVGIPEEALTGGLTGSIAVKPARDATEIPEMIWEDWQEIITYGAKAILFLTKEAAWYDPKQGLYYQQKFEAGAYKASGVGQKGHTKRAVRRSHGSFF